MSVDGNPFSEWPEPITITAVEAEYYAEICEAHSETGEDTLPLSREAACSWAISGYTPHQTIQIEGMILDALQTIRKLLIQLDFNSRQLNPQETTDAHQATPD